MAWSFRCIARWCGRDLGAQQGVLRGGYTQWPVNFPRGAAIPITITEAIFLGSLEDDDEIYILQVLYYSKFLNFWETQYFFLWTLCQNWIESWHKWNEKWIRRYFPLCLSKLTNFWNNVIWQGTASFKWIRGGEVVHSWVSIIIWTKIPRQSVTQYQSFVGSSTNSPSSQSSHHSSS